MLRRSTTMTALLLFVFCLKVGAQTLSASHNFHALKINKAKSEIELQNDEFWWGYFNGNYALLDVLGMGVSTSVPEPYNAALCIPAGSEIGDGNTIEGVSFSFPNSKNITDLKVWISTELPSTADAANIECMSIDKESITGMENTDNYVNEIRFDVPYKIDSTKDTWIGYSFMVVANEGESDMYPLFITGENSESHPKGLVIKVGKEGVWDDYSPYGFGDLAMRVLLSGEFKSNAAGIISGINKQSVVKGGRAKFQIGVENEGTNGIENMTFEVDIDGVKHEITYTPDHKIEEIASKHLATIEADVPNTAGMLPVRITLSKVNGMDNPSKKKEVKGNIIVVSEKVNHKVVYEEFSSLWFGWCVRGYVALDELRKSYGDNIVLTSAHMSDELDCKLYYDALTDSQPAPSAHVDRRLLAIDPYYGTQMMDSVPMGIKKNIDDCESIAPEASVKASALMEGNLLVVNAEVEFLFTGKGNYGLGYVITENGMHNDEWIQKNYFSGKDGYEDDPILGAWTMKDKEIFGLVYNDVVIAAEGVKNGIMGSVPNKIEEGKMITHQKLFNLKDCVTMQDKNNVNAIVMLFDKDTGFIVNADFVNLKTAMAIDGVDDDDRVDEVARYTADGRRIYSAEKGINIVRFSNGEVRKIIVK